MAGGALRATFVISRAGYAGLIAAGHHQLQEPSAHSRRAVWWHGQREQVPMLITGVVN
jgi:hypothetical protein